MTDLLDIMIETHRRRGDNMVVGALEELQQLRVFVDNQLFVIGKLDEELQQWRTQGLLRKDIEEGFAFGNAAFRSYLKYYKREGGKSPSAEIGLQVFKDGFYSIVKLEGAKK